MKIAVVGLGLIGGSICKSISKYTNHFCMGLDSDTSVMQKALNDNAINRTITPDGLWEAELTIVCLHPNQTISFIQKYADCFSKDSVVIDICGVKKVVMDTVYPLLYQKGVTFIGTHPIAGTEFSGYDYSDPDMFTNTNLILTPYPETSLDKIHIIENLAKQLNFGKIIHTSPNHHDRIIAYTSQLPNIVSNAYVKSPSLNGKDGFAGGSFKDMTRVANLNEQLWSELIMLNKDSILYELDNLMAHLKQYQIAIDNEDIGLLKSLIHEGRILKEGHIK